MENAINHDAINQINSKILDNIKKKELEEKNEKTQFVYSIDWLTFNIKLKDINNPFIRDEGIYAEEREQGTNIFKRVKDFYNTRDELIFTIVFQPHSKIIKQDFGQLQIANKWLYVGNLSKLVYKIFFQSNFELVNISRIDLCTDFFNFVDTYKPLSFIQDVARGNVLKVNPSKVNFWGKTGDYTIDYHAMNIGDRESTFNFKLYNKTKELEEKHEKGYIKTKWYKKLKGYEELIKMKETPTIWRLEVSIKDWNKIKIDGKKVIEINNDIFDILNYHPYFMQFFISKKFVWKNDYGKFIDFIDNPRKDLSSKYLCTNIPNNEEVNTTNKQKKQVLKSLISIIEQSITFEQANEYLMRVEDLIQEEDYYNIFKSIGYNYNTLSSYIAYKFNDAIKTN
jgi:hypothetical protein